MFSQLNDLFIYSRFENWVLRTKCCVIIDRSSELRVYMTVM